MVERQFKAEHLTHERATNTEYGNAWRKLKEIVSKGLRHGHFECKIACDVTNGKKRRLIIKAGESHQFIIPMEELDAAGL
jgi:hypothetical protein